jgi:hypothetical protein
MPGKHVRTCHESGLRCRFGVSKAPFTPDAAA